MKLRTSSDECERAVLGAILLDGKALEEVWPWLEPKDFHDERHRLVYRAIQKLGARGKPVDLVTVKASLSPEQLEKVGPAYLVTLTDGHPTATNVRHYARRIREHSRERGLFMAAQNVVTAIESADGGKDRAASELQARLADFLAGEREEGGHEFHCRGEDRYALTIPEIGTTLEIDRLRRESNDLMGELCVRCSLPGARTYDGTLSIADFNLSSARARSERAKLLAFRSNSDQIDWAGHLEEFCQRVLSAERSGQPAVDLRTLEEPPADDSIVVEGMVLPRRNPSILFGDGGAAKSYLALYEAGLMALRGMKVAFFDWELAGEDHRVRLRRLFGRDMPLIWYARCERPLAYEADRLRRAVCDNGVEYSFYDSVAFACDGPPESAEAASRYFRAVRQIGGGSCHIAHITKSESGDQKPFGSTFWHNGARSTYFVKAVNESADRASLEIGIFNRKANLGPLCRPAGFRITFEADRTFFTRSDPAEVPELAEKMTIRERMARLLRGGAMTPEGLAEVTQAKLETVKRTIRRYEDIFTVLDGGKVALLQRDR